MKKSNYKGMILDASYVRNLTDEGYRVLSERTVVMCLSLLNFQFWKTRWENLEAHDDFKSWVSRAQYELMREVEVGGGGVMAAACHPIGDVFMNAGATTPEGALPCNGATYLRADYPDLYEMLDDNLKIDADHFKTPAIINGRVPAGVGTYPVVIGGMSGTAIVSVGSELGEYAHTLSIEELPTHTHQQQYGTNSGMVQDNGFTGGYSAGTTPAGAPYTPLTTASAGGGQPHMNMPPITGLRFFIQAINCTAAEDEPIIGVRLSGCLLQYTRNNSMWFAVDGWGDLNDCIIHPPTGGEFGLRFNNCNLEYSVDGSQTWQAVPGWSSAATCFPDAWTPDDFNMRVEGGVLQYTEDGGDNWNPVFGWNTLQATFVTDKDRCECAYGFANVFGELLSELVGLLSEYQPSFPGDVIDGITAWINGNPQFYGIGLLPLSSAVEDIFYNMTAEELAGEFTALELKQVADTIFTFSDDGRWCDDDIIALTAHVECLALGADPHWTDLLKGFVLAIFDNPFEGRAIMARIRDYGSCANCDDLTVIEPCNSEPQDWNCFRNFGISGLGAWSVVMVYGGTQSMDTEGVRLTGDNTLIYKQLEIERPIDGDVSHVTFTSRFEHSSGGSDPRREVWARVGGNWVRATYWQAYSDGTFTDTASVPVGCDAIRLRIQFTTGYTSAWIKSAQMVINAINDPC